MKLQSSNVKSTQGAPAKPVSSCVSRVRALPPPAAPLSSQLLRSEGHSRRSITARAVSERVPRWEVVWEYLVVQRGFQSTGVQEAKELVDKDEYVLIDVRPRERHEESRVPGAISVPLYQKTDFSSFSFTKYLRAAALMVNGVQPVELNPKFMDELIQAAGGKGIILYDEIGGTLEPTSTFGNGKVSRSLLAVYQAIQSGKFDRVGHLRGGIYTWFRQGLPIEGKYDGSFAGRTPSVVEEKEFSYGRPPTLLETEDNLGGTTPR